ncbi:PrsW family intramembrane metalloprotease [Actinoplanes palleronii]|uniref:PrsW family intramembrane metalloprotease n=1 Tax=Actinoplanes palleronii TaxID=113570 RepID=UPI0019419880|nr:PrsW family glutamic-type intramembrane protease [Actinoplanes palleronii]
MASRWWRRWAWLAVLVVGVVLYVLVLATLIATQNINFVPSMILLGAVIIPATFLTFAQGRSGRWQVPGTTIGLTAFLGGVIGVVAAGWLEYDTLRRLGTVPMVLVGLIEESAKLLVPIVVLVVFRRRLSPSDGLVIGVASGMGFAALETMGYAFTALISSNGNIGDVEQTLFVRALTSPAAHPAWTGLTAGALFALAAAPGARALLVFAGTFVGAVTLHALWDSIGSGVAYVVLSVVSLTWLMIVLRRYRTFNAAHPVT